MHALHTYPPRHETINLILILHFGEQKCVYAVRTTRTLEKRSIFLFHSIYTPIVRTDRLCFLFTGVPTYLVIRSGVLFPSSSFA